MFTMIKRLLYSTLAVFAASALLTACLPATGDVTFWQETGSGFGITVVEINGSSANITQDYDADPDCGDPGCATFNLDYGTYSYTASDGNSLWSGTFEVDGPCLTFLLY